MIGSLACFKSGLVKKTMLDTVHLLRPTTFPPLFRGKLQTIQVNLGYRCNQTCKHCHVNAGPKRTEQMERDTIDLVLAFVDTQAVKTLDLTGGAPELNPYFRYFVGEARQRGMRVIDRCNLTILEEPGQESLAEFLAEQKVEVVASLPCYLEENVNKQRGNGVFDKSIRALQRLNKLGYGKNDSDLILNLVFNPQGATLPPAQEGLEGDYKKKLSEAYQLSFNQLFTITNMPISRFGSTLLSKGEFKPYMQLLKSSFSQENLDTVMCKTLISVDWEGYLYDCDFNQMLKIPLEYKGRPKRHLKNLMRKCLEGEPIQIAEHCYGCTAGQGSSCEGALSG